MVTYDRMNYFMLTPFWPAASKLSSLAVTMTLWYDKVHTYYSHCTHPHSHPPPSPWVTVTAQCTHPHTLTPLLLHPAPGLPPLHTPSHLHSSTQPLTITAHTLTPPPSPSATVTAHTLTPSLLHPAPGLLSLRTPSHPHSSTQCGLPSLHTPSHPHSSTQPLGYRHCKALISSWQKNSEMSHLLSGPCKEDREKERTRRQLLMEKFEVYHSTPSPVCVSLLPLSYRNFSCWKYF